MTQQQLNLLAVISVVVCTTGPYGITRHPIYTGILGTPQCRQRVPKLVPGLRLIGGHRVASS